MTKAQHTSFVSVETMLDILPDSERRIVDRLRTLVFDALPHIEERLAYNVPFYYLHKRIAYIWPATVPWGKVPTNAVHLGFPLGYKMRDDIGWMEKGTRAQVFVKTFRSVNDIDPEMVRAYLVEASEAVRQA